MQTSSTVFFGPTPDTFVARTRALADDLARLLTSADLAGAARGRDQ